MKKTLLDAIGNTPLVMVGFESKAEFLAKLEYLNPGGSIKDRSALYMVEEAEKEVAFLQMDFECHYGNKVETKECQEWRRDNDQDRASRKSVSGELEYYRETVVIQKNRFNELTGKYCIPSKAG